MTEDYESILDQTVDEVKESVKNLENPDYEKLLELEEEGKNRKTVVEFLTYRIEEMKENAEESVQQIEEETKGGFLGSFSREKVLTGGVIAGIVIGLLAGFAFNMQGAGGNPAEIRSSLTEFYELSGSSPNSVTVVERSGMYYATVNMTQRTENGTRTSSQSFYVSPDGDLLFPEVSSPFLTNPYNLNELISRARQQQQQGNSTNGTQ